MPSIRASKNARVALGHLARGEPLLRYGARTMHALEVRGLAANGRLTARGWACWKIINREGER